MRHLHAAFIALVAACPALISALPSSAAGHQPAPWRRLSNRIISTIWRASDNDIPVDARIHPTTGARTRHSSPLAARYGQDIVLRFSINTAEEANAIAEAAEDLYLDIWGFCDGWVDIRLAKDVVCQPIQRATITTSMADISLTATFSSRSSSSFPSKRPYPSYASISSC
jgi:extracellular matrix protein 14